MSTASNFSLLVVDDEPDLRTLYELTLLREGYRVDAAGSVDEALRASARRRSFDAVITDMRLPDGLGLELLRGSRTAAPRALHRHHRLRLGRERGRGARRPAPSTT